MKIVYIGLYEETLNLLVESVIYPEASFLPIPEADLLSSWPKIEDAQILLIGENTHNPIQITQQVYGHDSTLSILIISEAQKFQKIRQSLLFTPFIGPTVYAVSNAAGKGLVPIIKDHVQRTQQRRSYKSFQSSVAGKFIPSAQSFERVKEDYFNRVLQEAPVGLVLINRNGIILSFNRYAVTLFNRSEREVLGTSLAALFPENIKKDLVRLLKQSEETNLQKTIELQTENKLRYLEIIISNVEKDNPSYKVVLINEITDRVLAQKSIEDHAQKVKMIVDSMPEMAWTALPNGKVDYLNKRWYEYTDQDPEDFETAWKKAVNPDDLQEMLSLWKTALQNETSFQLECRYLRAVDQTFRWHLTRALPIKNQKGEILHWVGTCTDIESLKNTEKELQKTAEELAASNEEVTASYEELYESNERLIKVNEDLDNFVYTASHDLKAPITNIEGLVQLLVQRLNPEEIEDSLIKGIFERINSSISRFQRTIADLTEIVKLQRLSEQQAELTDISEVIHDVELDLFHLIGYADGQLEIQVEENSKVVFSRKNLKSIIYNLLSNAIKYRSNERRLHVRIIFYEEDKYYVLSVRDNGLGMDLKDPEKIFGMFQRMHSHVEGTGIGLYMVKKIIENEGGKIAVESQPGKGSNFRVYFPVK